MEAAAGRLPAGEPGREGGGRRGVPGGPQPRPGREPRLRNETLLHSHYGGVGALWDRGSPPTAPPAPSRPGPAHGAPTHPLLSSPGTPMSPGPAAFPHVGRGPGSTEAGALSKPSGVKLQLSVSCAAGNERRGLAAGNSHGELFPGPAWSGPWKVPQPALACLLICEQGPGRGLSLMALERRTVRDVAELRACVQGDWGPRTAAWGPRTAAWGRWWEGQREGPPASRSAPVSWRGGGPGGTGWWTGVSPGWGPAR